MLYEKGDIITLRVTKTHQGGYLQAETVNDGENEYDLFTRLPESHVRPKTLKNLGVAWARQLAMRDALKRARKA